MHVQEEELTPEQFQRKYDEYQFQYTVDFSNHFFESNKCEEWFRERYDPTLLVQSEQDVKMWSAAESKRIADIVNQSPESSAEYVQSCRLNIDDRKEIQGRFDVTRMCPPSIPCVLKRHYLNIFYFHFYSQHQHQRGTPNDRSPTSPLHHWHPCSLHSIFFDNLHQLSVYRSPWPRPPPESAGVLAHVVRAGGEQAGPGEVGVGDSE